MDIKDCLDKNLLRKESPSLEKAKRSIEIALLKLTKAKQLLKLRILDMAEVNAYSAMFHASRSLLFRDGFKEKSHYAVYVYLKEKYSTTLAPKFLNELNVLRMDRHEIFYGLEEQEFNEKEIMRIILLVEEFITAVKKLL